MSSRPTEKQIKFARDLGIDFEENITKSGLSRLITYAIKVRRREERGLTGFANETADRIRVPSERKLARLAQVGKFLRDNKIKERSIIRFKSDEFRKSQYVVLDIKPDGVVYLRCLVNVPPIFTTAHFVSYEGVGLVELLHNPAPGFAHPFSLYPYSGEKELRKFVAENILSENMYFNDHGVYWNIEAAAKLAARFCEGQRRVEQKSKEEIWERREARGRADYERRKAKHGKHFCNTCGKPFENTSLDHRSRRCPKCIEEGEFAGIECHCSYCGELFKKNTNGASRWLCPKDNPKNK